MLKKTQNDEVYKEVVAGKSLMELYLKTKAGNEKLQEQVSKANLKLWKNVFDSGICCVDCTMNTNRVCAGHPGICPGVSY